MVLFVPASDSALRAIVPACAWLPVCSASSPRSTHSSALFGSSRSARSIEAVACARLPAARSLRAWANSVPLAPLASLCGREGAVELCDAGGTDCGTLSGGRGCELGGGTDSGLALG